MPTSFEKSALEVLLFGISFKCNQHNFVISISHTTRKPRPNEIDGEDYHFVGEEEFDILVKKNSFFEHANIFDNYYGTLKKTVAELLAQGKDVLFDIDWQGTQQLKKVKNLSIVTIFILPPNIKVLKDRLLNRHQGQEKLIKSRMNKFSEEISHWNEYNYVVVNDDLNICYNNLWARRSILFTHKIFYTVRIGRTNTILRNIQCC